jgi:hypothetical protein
MMTERERRIQALKDEVEARLPQMAEMCVAPVEGVIFSQDAFAAGFQEDEYRLLGMAIKYIGLAGKDITIAAHKEDH